MFAEELLVPRSLRIVLFADGKRGRVSVDVRLNWFRALPLSCVEDLRASLDGVPFDPLISVLNLSDVECSLAEFAERDDIWWPVGEKGTISTVMTIPKGGEHVVSYSSRVRIPYFPLSAEGDQPTMFDRAVRLEVAR